MVPLKEHIKYIETILEQKAGEGFYEVCVYVPAKYYEKIRKNLMDSGYEVQKIQSIGDNYSTIIQILW